MPEGTFGHIMLWCMSGMWAGILLMPNLVLAYIKGQLGIATYVSDQVQGHCY